MGKMFKSLCITLLVATNIAGQVQIQTTLPVAGLVQKNQLWNLVIENGSMQQLQGRIEMVLLDRQTSQELMTAVSGEFTVEKGAMLVNVNKLMPVSYNYISIEPDQTINSLLPAGAYSVCYTFVRNPNSDKRESLAEECTAFDVEPLSPPMLTFPADSAVLEVAPAQFSWMPPSPLALLPRVRYEILITELLPSQQPAEAMAENMPFFSTEQSPAPVMVYPAAYPAFEKDKWYAWQVIARDDKNYAGKSEVWVFKISAYNPVQEILNGTPYMQLQRSGAGKTVAPNGILRFNYFNQLSDSEALITVEDMTGSDKNNKVTFTLPIVRGQNFLQKDISKYMKVQEGHVYKLSLENKAMEKWFVMFEIKKY